LGETSDVQSRVENLANGHTQRQQRTQLATERTDWAQQRTLLAGERTFSAWVRTGIAAVAAGLGIAKLLTSVAWPRLTFVIGGVFILAGAAAYVIALLRYRQGYAALRQDGMRGTPVWLLGLLVLALLVGAVLAFVLLLEEQA
jgi:putative membrane protein